MVTDFLFLCMGLHTSVTIQTVIEYGKFGTVATIVVIPEESTLPAEGSHRKKHGRKSGSKNWSRLEVDGLRRAYEKLENKDHD